MSAELLAGWVEILPRAFNAVINGLAQGLLPAAAVWLLLRSSPQTNAATRHAILFVTMLGIVALPALQLGWLFLPKPAAPAETIEQVLSERLQSDSAIQPADEILRVAPSDETDVPAEHENRSAEQAGLRAQSSEAESLPILPRIPETVPWNLSARVASGCLLLWLVLSTVRLAMLAYQCAVLRRIRRRARPASDILQEGFRSLQRELNVPERVPLLVSREMKGALVAGFASPAVVITPQLEEDPRVATLLRHELAHIARRDHWINLIQQTLGALFFFHPGVIWLSRRMSIEREIACDDHVLAARLNRQRYAIFLTDFASREIHRQWLAAPGAWSSSSQLKERIDMILNTKRNASPRLARWRAGIIGTTALGIAGLAMAALPRLVLAEDVTQNEETTVIASTEAPSSAVVTVTTSNALPSEETGPRVKVAQGGAGAGVIAASSAAPAIAGVVATPRVPATPSATPQPRGRIFAQTTPMPPENPDGDRSIERRLDRLEKMMKQLLREKPEKGEKPEAGEREERHNFRFDMKDLPTGQPPVFQYKFNNRELDVLKGNLENLRPALEEQKRALEKSRAQLEKQIAALDRQIARMEPKNAYQDKRGDRQVRGQKDQRDEDERKDEKREEKREKKVKRDSDDAETSR